jgi:hypothetical protein
LVPWSNFTYSNYFIVHHIRKILRQHLHCFKGR